MDNTRSTSWIKCDRLSKEYLDGVEDFLNHGFSEKREIGTIPCPCMECVLHYEVNRAMAYDHLVVNSIIPPYDTWFFHGENLDKSNKTSQNDDRQQALRDDDMRRMIHDAFGDRIQFSNNNISDEGEIEPTLEENTHNPHQPHPEIDKFEQLMKDPNKELYPGCKKFSKLSFLLHIYHIKGIFRWSNESFNALLGLLKDVFPEGGNLPSSLYETKKIVEGLGLKYNKIHASPNDCMLFRNQFVDKEVNECLVCGV